MQRYVRHNGRTYRILQSQSVTGRMMIGRTLPFLGYGNPLRSPRDQLEHRLILHNSGYFHNELFKKKQKRELRLPSPEEDT